MTAGLRSRLRTGRRWIGIATIAAATVLGADATQDAAANGDTRSLTIFHQHTKESATITFRRNGSYDSEGLRQLNWMLRDWRLDEQTRMEPRLFDLLWEVYREVGSEQPVHVVSAYRAPATNAMLRRRSRAVAEQSQHMAGRAMDFYLPDVSMSRVREIGMRLQRGGVGFYPNSLHPFVHLDAGSVRSWPRMTHEQLARLFPDGRTVHLPRDGRPLAGYEVAKAEILSRGGTVAGLNYADASEEPTTGRQSLWAALFGGGGDDEDSDYYRSAASRSRGPARAAGTRIAYAPAAGTSDDAGTRGVAVAVAEPRTEPSRNRRTGRTEVAAAEPSADPVAPAPGFEPTQTAAAAAPPLAAGLAVTRSPVEPTAQAALPPRRPEEFGITVASGPLPPARPVLLAGLSADVRGRSLEEGGGGRSYGAPAWTAGDDRAALRALFDAADPRPAPARRVDVAQARPRGEPGEAVRLGDSGLKVRMAFQPGRDDLPVGAFRGPAVAPLPRLP